MSTQTLEIPRRAHRRWTATAPPDTRHRQGSRLLFSRRFGLAAVLVVQVSMTLRLSATAFQDEALYLDAGHQILNSWRHGNPITEDFGSYFSGSPYVYPPLGALADTAGGLAGARLFSLVCCVITTALIASVGRCLYGQTAGVAGAAAFILSGPVIFVGHFATYDAMALMLLVAGLATGLSAAENSRRGRAGLLASCSGFLLAGAVVTKYVAALFVPSILLLILMTVFRMARSPAPDFPGGRRYRESAVRVRSAGRLLCVALGMTVGAVGVVGCWLWLTGTGQLSGLVTTTLSRKALGPTSPVEVARQGLEWAAPTLLVAIVGMVLVGRRRPALTALLLLSSLLPIIFQARSGELTSLHKHVAFGLVFAAPLAGAGVAFILGRIELYDSRRQLAPRLLAVSLAAVMLLASGVRNAHELFRGWADSKPLTALLKTQVRFGSGHYLVEESEVPRYYLEGLTAPWQWSGTYFLYYQDPRNGAAYTGLDAYRHALTDRYFDVVVLRFGPTATLDWQIQDVLNDRTKYRKIARLPEPGGWTVWHRMDS